jgi:hypothetical protein
MFTILNLLLIVSIAGMAVAATHFIKERRFKNRVMDKYFIRNAEARRVNGLPALNTKYFMRIPSDIAMGNLYRQNLDDSRKTFRVYNGFVIAIDDMGVAWVSRVTPTVIMSLRVSEYRQVTHYFVPIAGRKERTFGETAEKDGLVITSYPYFMCAHCNHTECADWWAEWLVIEKAYRAAYEGQKYDWASTLDWIYPKNMRLQSYTV